MQQGVGPIVELTPSHASCEHAIHSVSLGALLIALDAIMIYAAAAAALGFLAGSQLPGSSVAHVRATGPTMQATAVRHGTP